MSNDKSKDRRAPAFCIDSEIFRDRPTPNSAGGSGGMPSNTIGAEQGIEFFGGDAQPARRARPNKKHLEPAREIPVFAETDVLVWAAAPAGTPRPSPPPGSAPTCCWWSATTTWAASRPAAS